MPTANFQPLPLDFAGQVNMEVQGIFKKCCNCFILYFKGASMLQNDPPDPSDRNKVTAGIVFIFLPLYCNLSL